MATTEGWFLAGDPNKDDFNQGLKQPVHKMILRNDFYSPVNSNFLNELFFHIDSDEWKENFSEIFDIRYPLPTNRIHFICNKVSLDWKGLIPEGYELLQVDSTLDVDSLEFTDDIREWTEHSIEDQKKRGFGKCLVHGNKVVVWINSDGASGDECEIGIITTEEYRLKGLGSATAAATVDYCLNNGYSTVGWHCEDHNYGSIGTAQKVGFVKERDYVHYICMFDEAEHFAESGMRHFLDKRYEEAIADFEKAFTIGEVPVWTYLLSARSYATYNNIPRVKELIISAKENGWTNWDAFISREEIVQLQENEDFKNFIDELLS